MSNHNIDISKISKPLETLHEHLEAILSENVNKTEILQKIAAGVAKD